MILGILTAVDANVSVRFVRSLIQVADHDIVWQHGSSIATNRNEIYKTAIKLNEDLLFIDSDMVFTKEDVARIEKDLETYDVVTGVCAMRFDTHPPAIFDDKMQIASMQEDIFPVHACGAAFLGISKRVKLSTPFTPRFPFGEDVSFCLNAHDAGYLIHCDPKLSIGHIMSNVVFYE